MWVRFEHKLHYAGEDDSESGSCVLACQTLIDWRHSLASSPLNESSVDESNVVAVARALMHC